ncbi:MAG: hypothetical protein IJ850_09140 [Alistipes sp.]|uniref:AbiH family protein n=1 Tax=Alistipes TaxID=239759 RepID=UPI00101CD9DA|nr:MULTISPECIES: AbiH family protein [Alistipes]MBR2218487.1 hypothetical protein [Alistipes sp.]
MMNRIILIGNGFDLAHGLKTSYMDFIKSYWAVRLTQLIQNDQMKTDDELCSYELPDLESRKAINQVRPYIFDDRFSYILGRPIAEALQKIKQEYHSKFFEEINKAVDTYYWVDIEAVYYRWLTKIFKQGECEYSDPNKLNDELKMLEEKLVVYLTYIQTNFIKSELQIENIRSAIYEPFDANDISNGGKSSYKNFLTERIKLLATHPEEEINQFLHKYGYSYLERHSVIDLYNDQIIKREGLPGLTDPLNYSKHIANVYENRETVPDDYLLPDDILFLNFNYTSTADLYIPKGSEFRVNHIHGELGNDKNPIIFGYGDELDDDYKEISKLNDNDYLKNIKSIRYLETDNYRKLLSFIDSAPFQIYIMGHSCGNSDRTLLNTLFEHKNCVSIKPFYYEKPDGSDNYIEIIQNISRNFNDMRLMRDRVVNKTYCRPLIPQGK